MEVLLAICGGVVGRGDCVGCVRFFEGGYLGDGGFYFFFFSRELVEVLGWGILKG